MASFRVYTLAQRLNEQGWCGPGVSSLVIARACINAGFSSVGELDRVEIARVPEFQNLGEKEKEVVVSLVERATRLGQAKRKREAAEEAPATTVAPSLQLVQQASKLQANQTTAVLSHLGPSKAAKSLGAAINGGLYFSFSVRFVRPCLRLSI